MRSALLERFGPEFVGLVAQMGLSIQEHLAELLDSRPEEQQQLAMAWMRAATALEADWAALARRDGGAGMDLARYLEVRLPSPRRALAAQQYAQQQKVAEQVSPPEPTPRERASAQRRIRLEAAIDEARAAVRRVDAIDRLVDDDRQAIVAQLEELISVISRRLNP